MRPTPGLVSRGGVWAGWPAPRLARPMTRTVADLAMLLDVMVGYDPEDPLTAHGVGLCPRPTPLRSTRTASRARASASCGSRWAHARAGLRGLQEVTAVFDQAVARAGGGGRGGRRPHVIPTQRAAGAPRRRRWRRRRRRRGGVLRAAPQPAVQDEEEVRNSPDYGKVMRRGRSAGAGPGLSEASAREELMTNLLKVMADHKLDAIVHKTVEHQPTLITDGINPPYANPKGAPHLNTFLVYVAVDDGPAGFTPQHCRSGITFLGRPYTEPTMIKLAYAYEQATIHRSPPASTPPLPSRGTSHRAGGGGARDDDKTYTNRRFALLAPSSLCRRPSWCRDRRIPVPVQDRGSLDRRHPAGH